MGEVFQLRAKRSRRNCASIFFHVAAAFTEWKPNRHGYSNSSHASFLTQVAENIASMRPATRREASDVDLKARCAVLAQNHRDVATGSSLASAPFISLEIKPKCGFVDQMNRVDVARFQMHQSLKLADGRVLQTPPACPEVRV